MTGKKSKIVSLVLIALMLSAIFGALPAIMTGASESENGTISITITDDSGDAVPAGFVINVYNIYADSMSNYTLSTGGYIKIDVPPGQYVIQLPSQIVEGKAYMSASSNISAVESGKTTHITQETVAKELEHTVSGQVTYSGNPVESARVEFVNYSNNFTFSTTTDEDGNYSLMVYDGTYSMWVEKNGVGRYYESLSVSANISNKNIVLTKVPYIKGFVYDQDGNGIEGDLHVTIYNETNKIIKTYVGTGPFFKVPAFEGEFSVFIAAEGYDTYYNSSVSVSASEDLNLGNIPPLNAIDPSSDHTVFTFKDGFVNLTMVRNLTYAPYNALSAMGLYDSGNIRYQLDVNHDGVVDANEEESFTNGMKAGMKPVSTGDSLMVNGISYKVTGTVDVTVTGAAGPIDSSDPISIVVKADFKAVKNISTDNVEITSKVRYDSDFMNYSYSIALPKGYERSSFSASENVSMEGYTDISIDPTAGTGMSDISIGVTESKEGKASIDIEPSEYIYKWAEKNNTYIAKVNKNVSFNAVFEDPNGHEDDANYTWTMDGTTLYGKTVKYAFSTGKNYTVELTVRDVGGNNVSAKVYILADGSAPTAVAKPTSPVSADENEKIEFNASDSTDKIFGSTNGVIVSYRWDFGDGNSSVQKVADHAYKKWGTYTVTLNVTDAVGNYDTTTITVNVKDITPPVAIFNWTVNNETESSEVAGTATVTVGDEVSFDASPSYDPAGHDGTEHSITYGWYFEDSDSTDTGKVITHTFNDAGTYAVKLNVTDELGNSKEITKIFEVKHGPVPRLEVKNLTLSTSEPRAGQTIQIIANVSNYGDADANEPSIIFYVNDKELSGNPRFYVYDNGSLIDADQTIPAGEYRIVKIDWTPEKGTVKLKVNVTDAAEPSSSFLNEKEIKVTVGQPVWMDYIPAILAIVAIVGVVAIYYMYSKGIGPFSTEKKDKGNKKD